MLAFKTNYFATYVINVATYACLFDVFALGVCLFDVFATWVPWLGSYDAPATIAGNCWWSRRPRWLHKQEFRRWRRALICGILSMKGETDVEKDQDKKNQPTLKSQCRCKDQREVKTLRHCLATRSPASLILGDSWSWNITLDNQLGGLRILCLWKAVVDFFKILHLATNLGGIFQVSLHLIVK